MKIGAFAKKFGLNVSTVRYYINNGLLVPTKKNEQYEFDQESISDMKKILEYKAYHFSLEEIQRLFFLEKTSRFQDEIVLEVYADILQSKRKQLVDEKNSLNDAIDALDVEISRLPLTVPGGAPKWGIPFSFIPYLYCPYCQQPLKMDSASLSEGFLQKGKLWCECGYRAEIRDGLILCEDFDQETPFKAFSNVESVFAMNSEFSSQYRKLITKTYLWMYNQAADWLEEPQFILAGPFTFNFLLEYMEKLSKDHFYIIVDPSLKRIQKIRQYLQDSPYQVICIVGKPSAIPVRHGQIGLYIDDYSTANSLFTYNDFGIDSIAPLLKNGGCCVGIFTGYKNAAKSLDNFKLDHPDFQPSGMRLTALKAAWERQGVLFNETKQLGETNGQEKHFLRNAADEQIQVYGYTATKRKKGNGS